MKPRYVIVEGEWKIVYSSTSIDAAKSIMQSYQTEFPRLAGEKYFTLYEMTAIEEATDVAQEQKEV